MVKCAMALNIKKLMTPDHPEVTFPPPPLIASKGHEEHSLEDHISEEDILLEDKKREALKRQKKSLEKLDIIS
jgi:hypothetical protein